MRVTPSLISKNADAFFLSLRFSSGTLGSPEGKAAKMLMHLLDFVV
jgi:hypothetical protein